MNMTPPPSKQSSPQPVPVLVKNTSHASHRKGVTPVRRKVSTAKSLTPPDSFTSSSEDEDDENVETLREENLQNLVKLSEDSFDPNTVLPTGSLDPELSFIKKLWRKLWEYVFYEPAIDKFWIPELPEPPYTMNTQSLKQRFLTNKRKCYTTFENMNDVISAYDENVWYDSSDGDKYPEAFHGKLSLYTANKSHERARNVWKLTNFQQYRDFFPAKNGKNDASKSWLAKKATAKQLPNLFCDILHSIKSKIIEEMDLYWFLNKQLLSPLITKTRWYYLRMNLESLQEIVSPSPTKSKILKIYEEGFEQIKKLIESFKDDVNNKSEKEVLKELEDVRRNVVVEATVRHLYGEHYPGIKTILEKDIPYIYESKLMKYLEISEPSNIKQKQAWLWRGGDGEPALTGDRSRALKQFTTKHKKSAIPLIRKVPLRDIYPEHSIIDNRFIKAMNQTRERIKEAMSAEFKDEIKNNGMCITIQMIQKGKSVNRLKSAKPVEVISTYVFNKTKDNKNFYKSIYYTLDGVGRITALQIALDDKEDDTCWCEKCQPNERCYDKIQIEVVNFQFKEYEWGQTMIGIHTLRAMDGLPIPIEMTGLLSTTGFNMPKNSCNVCTPPNSGWSSYVWKGTTESGYTCDNLDYSDCRNKRQFPLTPQEQPYNLKLLKAQAKKEKGITLTKQQQQALRQQNRPKSKWGIFRSETQEDAMMLHQKQKQKQKQESRKKQLDKSIELKNKHGIVLTPTQQHYKSH